MAKTIGHWASDGNRRRCTEFRSGGCGEVTGALALRQRGRAAQDPRTVESRGVATAGLFMLALLASGFSSSVIGIMAGQAIMQGLVCFRIPLWLRRLVVIMPSFAVISAGIEITHALVLSQVVLSLGLPTRWWLLSGSPLTAM
jgi:Mn2+/Fe2+ NRAMP family transporter